MTRIITQPTWVALNGVAGAGKDSLACVLVDRYGWTRVAFADPLREMALAIDPWVNTSPRSFNRMSELVERHGWDYCKRRFDEVRRILQRIGTDAVRAQSPNYWVDLARAKAIDAGTPVVFTDCRFWNEAEMVRDHGGFVVRIDAETELDGENASHASESALADWPFDRVFRNPRTDDPDRIAQRVKHFAKILADPSGSLISRSAASLD